MFERSYCGRSSAVNGAATQRREEAARNSTVVRIGTLSRWPYGPNRRPVLASRWRSALEIPQAPIRRSPSTLCITAECGRKTAFPLLHPPLFALENLVVPEAAPERRR